MTRTDRAFREIAAPPDAVFAAMVGREPLLAWLPPAGMVGRFERFDVRSGGSYRLVLTYAEGSGEAGKTGTGSDVVEARVVEVVEGVRVVQQIDFESDDPAYAGTMTMTWSLEPTDTGVQVEIRADDVPEGISARDHEIGMTSSLDNLEAYVTGSRHGREPARPASRRD
jgi:uncharacterized protein YndB with AHSA1/START domain